MKRAAAGQHLERLALAAQQNERGGIARTHDRVAQLSPGRGGSVYGGHDAARLASAGIAPIYGMCAILSIMK